MKILFMGNHNIAVGCLEFLIERGHEVVGLVGIPEDPEERPYYRSVTELAERHGIRVWTPAKVNQPEVVAEFAALRPELITVVSYRQILRPPILSIPSKGVINLHGSLLPKFRGASPINWVLIKGETETGVSIHYIDEKVDHGPIIAQRPIPIAFDDTAVSLFDKVTEEGIELFKEVIGYFESGNVPTFPNRAEEGSYYYRRHPKDGIIDWNLPAIGIYNLIRALVFPFPGAFSYFGGRKCTVWWGLPISARPPDAQPGQVFKFHHSGQWAVAAGEGAILLDRVEVEGSGEGPAEEVFARAGVCAGSVAEAPQEIPEPGKAPGARAKRAEEPAEGI